MDVFELAALATLIRFIFWILEKVTKAFREIAHKRRTLQREVGPEEPFTQDPRD